MNVFVSLNFIVHPFSQGFQYPGLSGQQNKTSVMVWYAAACIAYDPTSPGVQLVCGINT